MKKAFIILTLLIAFNFTVPNSQGMGLTLRHLIEYRQEDKSRGLNNSEMLKNKVVIYLRMHMMVIKVIRIDANDRFNTS